MITCKHYYLNFLTPLTTGTKNKLNDNNKYFMVLGEMRGQHFIVISIIITVFMIYIHEVFAKHIKVRCLNFYF